MNWWLLIIIPFSSAFIGWASNRIFVKMLFYPYKPVRIFGFTLQGIFPKRQRQLAQTLGSLVSREWLSFGDLEEKITNPESIKKIMPVAEVHIDDFLRNKLKEGFPMISMVGDRTLNTLKEIFMKELEAIFPVIMKGYLQNLQQDLDLEQTITDKIATLQTEKIEAELYHHAGRELRQVGLIGAAIGLLIGLVQVCIILIIK
ncbi:MULTISPECIES: DUF445 domain-containing protein [Niastella]|uniref:DUF445 family protein n=1 Tax=Niastella soli TaxID=2821487 RepID=A0ABS3YWA8_9BACT|nr:DUF445 family protein [Niastella soli]MBO9202219.1 DUF445 family protein [Niastella soli]